MTRAARGVGCALAFTLGACRGGSPAGADAVPRLELEVTRIDFGAARTHETLTRRYKVHNRGGGKLVLKLEAGHECSSSWTEGTIAPRRDSELSVSCRPEHHGEFLSTLVVGSNDPDKPRTVVELAAQVTPLLAWDRPLLAFALPFGEERRETLHLIGARARDARLSLSEPVDPSLALTLGHGESGDTLTVTARGARVGFHSGELKLHTGLDDPSELSLPFSCQVTGTLSVDPSNPYFDLLAAGGRTVRLTVTSTQPHFRLLGVEVLDGPFSAHFDAKATAPYHVDLSFLTERAAPDARGVAGHVRLRSTDASEPDKTLDLFALGRAAANASP